MHGERQAVTCFLLPTIFTVSCHGNNPDETRRIGSRVECRRWLLIVVGRSRWNIVRGIISGTMAVSDRRRPLTLSVGCRICIGCSRCFQQLRVVVLVGKKAGRARSSIRAWASGVIILELPHPSPMFVNRSVRTTATSFLQGLRDVREVLGGTGRDEESVILSDSIRGSTAGLVGGRGLPDRAHHGAGEELEERPFLGRRLRQPIGPPRVAA